MSDDIFFKGELRNDELLKLMHELRSEKTSPKMLEVLKCAASSEFIVPVDFKNGKYGFHAVGDSRGRRFIVSYADTGTFVTTESDENQKGVKSSFEDLMAVALDDSLGLDGIIINPGSAEVVLGRELLESVNGQMRSSSDDQTEMIAGDPSEYPAGLEDAVKNFAVDEPAVKRIFVKVLTSRDGSVMRWLFVIDTDESGEMKDYLLDTFTRYIGPYLGGFEPVVADLGQDFARKAAGSGKAFYERA